MKLTEEQLRFIIDAINEIEFGRVEVIICGETNYIDIIKSERKRIDNNKKINKLK